MNSETGHAQTTPFCITECGRRSQIESANEGGEVDVLPTGQKTRGTECSMDARGISHIGVLSWLWRL